MWRFLRACFVSGTFSLPPRSPFSFVGEGLAFPGGTTLGPLMFSGYSIPCTPLRPLIEAGPFFFLTRPRRTPFPSGPPDARSSRHPNVPSLSFSLCPLILFPSASFGTSSYLSTLPPWGEMHLLDPPPPLSSVLESFSQPGPRHQFPAGRYLTGKVFFPGRRFMSLFGAETFSFEVSTASKLVRSSRQV